jgi:hypothetical protein
VHHDAEAALKKMVCNGGRHIAEAADKHEQR